MLDKYEHFRKISKTNGCSFYDAEDRTITQSVLLKRLQQKCSWDQLLTNKNLQFMSKARFAPKMLQIFKKKGYYFMVYEKPTGQPLSEPEQIGKMNLQRFYPLFLDLCQNCIEIKQQSPQMYILPEWVFINRNLTKIGHFQPFFTSDEETSKHVFMYNLERTIQNSSRLMADSDTPGFERKQSLVYNLGIIAYQLLTGKKAINAPENQQDYNKQHKQLEEQAYKRLERATKDEKFSEMLAKMIKQDPFDCPTLNEILNFTKSKSRQYEPKNCNNPTVEVDMERIQLTDKYNQRVQTARRRFLRPCCKTTENEEADCVSLEKKGNLTMAYVKRDHHTHTQTHKRNRSFLPEITPCKQHRYQSRDSVTRPTMLKSQGDLRFKQL